jgi:phloretin hydrolase
MGAYNMQKVPISDEERKSPYYKYFERDMVRPPAEKIRMLKYNPLTPETALRFEDKNDLFRDGYLPGEFGYTRLKDNTITFANLTAMPGVTAEMVDWWFWWHQFEPMRYKIWDPEEHYSSPWLNLAQAQDTSLSIRERIWNNSSIATERLGGGKPQKLKLYCCKPADFGFDPQKLVDFKGTIVCGGGIHIPALLCHFFRPTADGVELRTRGWI